MCKHVLNAQVSIRSPCCKKWFDCAECHAEQEDHPLQQTTEMIFICKKCKKAFRKQMETFEESDEYCPNCDNHFVLDAVTPQARLEVEGEDVRKDARYDALDGVDAALTWLECSKTTESNKKANDRFLMSKMHPIDLGRPETIATSTTTHRDEPDAMKILRHASKIQYFIKAFGSKNANLGNKESD